MFAAAAACYGRGNPLLAVERPETQALLPVLAGRDVLDLGCGPGHHAALARASGASLVLGLDREPAMLREAAGLRLVGEAERLPLRDGSFDVVVAGLLLSYVDLAAALAEVARVLRPGGALVASDLHPAAARLGWRRTFAAADGPVEARAQPPTRARIERAVATAGLSLDVVREVPIDARLRPAFEQAGRTDFARLSGAPLLLLWRARR